MTYRLPGESINILEKGSSVRSISVFRPFDRRVLNLTKHHMAERFFSPTYLKAIYSNMTKPYRNLLIVFFQLTWFQINCFGSGSGCVFKVSKAERYLFQCLERVWDQVTKSRRVKRLLIFSFGGSGEHSSQMTLRLIHRY